MLGKLFSLDGKYRMKVITISLFLLLSIDVYASKKTMFLNKMYGQLHQNASRHSRILSTFECGQPFTVSEQNDDQFLKASYATYDGFILRKLLSKKRPKDCWQDKYSKFFQYLGMGVTEMHYMGRLQDLLIQGSVMP